MTVGEKVQSVKIFECEYKCFRTIPQIFTNYSFVTLSLAGTFFGRKEL